MAFFYFKIVTFQNLICYKIILILKQINMKNSLQNFVFLSASLFLLNSFNTDTKEKYSSNFQDAISKHKIIATLKANGHFSGNSVILEMKNNTNTPLKLSIPIGTLFSPSNEGEQTLITVEEQFVLLEPKKKASQVIDGYCCEASDACPKPTSTFQMSANKNEKFNQLFGYMKGKGISKSLYQSIVWTVSNNHDVSSIPKDNPTNSDLRKFLCKLTNQIDKWYCSSIKRSIDKSGNIQSNTEFVGGTFSYDCPKNTIIHQEIHKESGGLISRGENKRTVKDGEIVSSFHLNVKNWAKGKYFLKIMTSKNVIAEYEFMV
jgi:hypothetical protein